MPGQRPAVADEQDQVPRLLEFRRAHPGVEIILSGLWRAAIPAGTVPGEDMAVYKAAYRLADLLDKLDAVFAPP